jgi:dTDP-glucose 4,6-dehydratase
MTNIETTLLVTGGCGFIGSHFINHIYYKTNYNIINIDAMYYCASESNILQEIRDDNKRYKLIKGNLCSYDLVSHVINDYNVNYVIHFAAQSHVQNSFEDSLQYTKDNILGTHTLLEACRKYGKIQKFIHVSTDEVYGESMLPSHCNEDIDNISTKCTEEEEKKKTEESILCPTNPYAATKAGAELIAQSYYHSFKLPIIITRGNNVYGPNQYPEKLIPRFIQLLQNDKPVTIQGTGSSVRAFLHAIDTAHAFQVILEKGAIGEIYNIGCDEGMEYSVAEVAKMLIRKIKNTEDYDKWISYIEDRPFNDQRYYISNQKLKDLGWTISVNFEQGLDALLTLSRK